MLGHANAKPLEFFLCNATHPSPNIQHTWIFRGHPDCDTSSLENPDTGGTKRLATSEDEIRCRLRAGCSILYLTPNCKTTLSKEEKQLFKPQSLLMMMFPSKLLIVFSNNSIVLAFLNHEYRDFLILMRDIAINGT
jgi:hypothetical protein